MPPQKRSTKTVARRTSNQKYDWDHLQQVFVEGLTLEDGSVKLLTLKELSDQFGVPYQRVREKSSELRWRDRRDKVQQELAYERQKQHRKRMVGESVEFDKNALNAAKIGVMLVTQRLGEIAKTHSKKASSLQEAQERLANGEAVEPHELYSAIWFKEIEGLAGALDRFQNIGMKALGTDIQKHEVTNPDGSMSTTVNVVGELHRDDPERLALILQAMRDTGILPSDALEIEDAEVVEEEKRAE
jgi:hypothetical protein